MADPESARTRARKRRRHRRGRIVAVGRRRVARRRRGRRRRRRLSGGGDCDDADAGRADQPNVAAPVDTGPNVAADLRPRPAPRRHDQGRRHPGLRVARRDAAPPTTTLSSARPSTSLPRTLPRVRPVPGLAARLPADAPERARPAGSRRPTSPCRKPLEYQIKVSASPTTSSRLLHNGVVEFEAPAPRSAPTQYPTPTGTFYYHRSARPAHAARHRGTACSPSACRATATCSPSSPAATARSRSTAPTTPATSARTCRTAACA